MYALIKSCCDNDNNKWYLSSASNRSGSRRHQDREMRPTPKHRHVFTASIETTGFWNQQTTELVHENGKRRTTEK